MPTFYFHIRDESGTVKKDEAGVDLTNAGAAKEQAIQTGRQFLDKEVSAVGLQPDEVTRLAVEVQDDSGKIICTIPLSELQTLPGGSALAADAIRPAS
jgi:hypothetical protein